MPSLRGLPDAMVRAAWRDPTGWLANWKACDRFHTYVIFLFIKVLGRDWPALWVSFGRVALGAATLLILVAVRRERLPRDRRLWLHCAVAALSFNTISWTLIAFAEQHVSSIIAGLLNATTPLWVLLVSMAAFPEQRPTVARIGGLAIGFLGVAVLLGPWRGLGGGQLIGYLAGGGAALCYGLGFPYTRRHLAGRRESGVVLSACQLVCATVMLGVFLPLAPGPSGPIGLDGVGSLLALGALGSGVAFALNYAIVRAKGATTASTVTYLVPVFSTVLGATVLAEPLHWNQAVGAVVLLLGIAISQGRVRAFSSARPEGSPHPEPQPAPSVRPAARS
jgi:drug/metabolite transporter (DMT)-like permease